jgi:hypothetical protein
VLAGIGLLAAGPALRACQTPSTKSRSAATQTARTASVTTPPVVSVYGRPGSFGQLSGRTALPSGQAVTTVGVPSWGFGAGQSAYMSAVTSDGVVVMATTPYTDNQLQPTARDMELGVFDPTSTKFTRVQIPTTAGYSSVTEPGGSYGGADIGDVQVVGSGSQERVIFASAVPYHGWDIARYGQFPSIGALGPSSNGWTVAAGFSETADQLAATAPSVSGVVLTGNAFGQPYHDGRGLCEIALLPASGHLVVTQYFGPSLSDQQGGLLVIDAAGNLKASWRYPQVTHAGRSIRCLVREVESDPSSSFGDERFVVVCDSFDNVTNESLPFPVQEFSYDARNGTVRPTSVPVQCSSDGSRVESTKFGVDGTLYVARTKPDGMTADRMAVYRKGALAAAAPPVSGWASTKWGTVVGPAQFVDGTQSTGLQRSLALDPATGAILVAGISGLLVAVVGGAGSARVTATVDMGLDFLTDRNSHMIGIRKGAVDVTRRLLWLPIPQLSTTSTYPAASYPALDQWLYCFRLDTLLGPTIAEKARSRPWGVTPPAQPDRSARLRW